MTATYQNQLSDADDFYAQLLIADREPAARAKPTASYGMAGNALGGGEFDADADGNGLSSWLGLLVCAAVGIGLVAFSVAFAPTDVRTTFLANGGHAVNDLLGLLAAGFRGLAG